MTHEEKEQSTKSVLKNLATKEDEYIVELQDRGEAIWIAELSNGFKQHKVYMDDGRAGLEIPSAWLRLKHFIDKSKYMKGIEYYNFKIENISLKFRDNIKPAIFHSAEFDGVYFSRLIVNEFSSPETSHGFVFGYLYKDYIYIQKWLIPQLQMFHTEVRANKKIGPGLIKW